MKKIMLTLLLVMFCNISYAEIIRDNNSFDNSKIIVSCFYSKNIEIPEPAPREIAFKKEISSYGNDYYMFIKTNDSQKYWILTSEDTKIKFDNNKIIKTQTQSDNNPVKAKLSFHVTQEMLSEISNTQTLSIQIPFFSSKAIQTEYVVYNIPKLVIDEWKQVIEMN